jgi:hypothetical protein
MATTPIDLPGIRARDAKYSGTRAEEVGGSVADRRALLQLVDDLERIVRRVANLIAPPDANVHMARAALDEALALVDGARQEE